jgi:hypothetical protein
MAVFYTADAHGAMFWRLAKFEFGDGISTNARIIGLGAKCTHCLGVAYYVRRLARLALCVLMHVRSTYVLVLVRTSMSNEWSCYST